MQNLNKEYIGIRVIPFFIFGLIMLFDRLAKKYEKFLYNANPLILFLIGLSIIGENWMLDKYRVYETWILLYFHLFLVWIVHWFEWKKIVLTFIVLKSIYIVVSIIVFRGDITVFLFISSIVSNFALVVIWMVISTMVRVFLETIYKNRELVRTIKEILQVIPEPIFIQWINNKTHRNILKFANDNAQKKMFSNLNAIPKYLDDSSFDFKISESSLEDFKSSSEYSNSREEIKLSHILEYHQHHLEFQSIVKEFTSSIETVSTNPELRDSSRCYYQI